MESRPKNVLLDGKMTRLPAHEFAGISGLQGLSA